MAIPFRQSCKVVLGTAACFDDTQKAFNGRYEYGGYCYALRDRMPESARRRLISNIFVDKFRLQPRDQGVFIYTASTYGYACKLYGVQWQNLIDLTILSTRKAHLEGVESAAQPHSHPSDGGRSGIVHLSQNRLSTPTATKARKKVKAFHRRRPEPRVFPLRRTCEYAD